MLIFSLSIFIFPHYTTQSYYMLMFLTISKTYWHAHIRFLFSNAKFVLPITTWLNLQSCLILPMDVKIAAFRLHIQAQMLCISSEYLRQVCEGTNLVPRSFMCFAFNIHYALYSSLVTRNLPLGEDKRGETKNVINKKEVTLSEQSKFILNHTQKAILMSTPKFFHLKDE